MAKGDPSGVYIPEVITQGASLEEVVLWLFLEHNRLAVVLDIALARSVEFLNVQPTRPREGMVTGADGTNWNPGSGKGVYAYYSGAWHLLG